MSRSYKIVGQFFKTKASGNWNDPLIWLHRDYKGNYHNTGIYPTQNDNVYIEQNHTVTLVQNENCKNLNYFKDSITKINTGIFTLSIYGVFRRYIGTAPGKYSSGANGSTPWLVGFFSLKGLTRTQSLMEYAAARNLYGYTVSIDLNAGENLTLDDPSLTNQSINLGGTFNLNTGNIILQNCTLRVSQTDPQIANNDGTININSLFTIISQVASFQQINRSATTSIGNLNINSGGILQMNNTTQLRFITLQYGATGSIVINGNITLANEIPNAGSGTAIPYRLTVNNGFNYNLNAKIVNIRDAFNAGGETGTTSNGTLNQFQP